MLILYTKNDCNYCDKVKKVFLERSVVYEERNIKDQIFLKEAIDKGARTMPFLVDTLSNISFGESDEIIDYASEYSF